MSAFEPNFNAFPSSATNREDISTFKGHSGVPSKESSIPSPHLQFGGLFCNGTSCHGRMDLSEVELRPSEALPERYIMLDHSGNKKTIIFNPALEQDQPFLESYADVFKKYIRSNGMGACTQVVDISYKGLATSNNKGKEAPNEKPVYWGSVSRSGVGGESTIVGGSISMGVESGNAWHESTEDIDALLSSDGEEGSTGRSPSVFDGSEENHKAYGRTRANYESDSDEIDSLKVR